MSSRELQFLNMCFMSTRRDMSHSFKAEMSVSSSHPVKMLTIDETFETSHDFKGDLSPGKGETI